MPKTLIEKMRIPISRVVVGLFVLLVLFSESMWENSFPIVSTILFVFGIVLVAIASLGRLWCSLYIAGKKTNTLVVNGPYSVSRNPLYFFSLLGAIGVGLASETFLLAFLAFLAFVLYYPFVMKDEARRLKSIYGEDYEVYERDVPYFWPKWSLLKEPDTYEVDVRIFRKHIASALWFIWTVGFLELVEALHEIHVLPILFRPW